MGCSPRCRGGHRDGDRRRHAGQRRLGRLGEGDAHEEGGHLLVGPRVLDLRVLHHPRDVALNCLSGWRRSRWWPRRLRGCRPPRARPPRPSPPCRRGRHDQHHVLGQVRAADALAHLVLDLQDGPSIGAVRVARRGCRGRLQLALVLRHQLLLRGEPASSTLSCVSALSRSAWLVSLCSTSVRVRERSFLSCAMVARIGRSRRARSTRRRGTGSPAPPAAGGRSGRAPVPAPRVAFLDREESRSPEMFELTFTVWWPAGVPRRSPGA